MRGILLLAGVSLMSAAPVLAGETAELACAQNGYSAEQKAEIDGLLSKVDLLTEGEDPAMEALGELAFDGTSECAAQFGWSDAEVELALLYEFGRLLEVGFLRYGKLSGDEIATVDAALAKGDRTALWAAIEEQVAIGMEGDSDSVSDANATLFGLFIMETGVGLEEGQAEQVGAYLAAKAMQRVSARRFVAVQ